MTPGQLRAKIVAERAAWIRRMVASLRALPGESFETFQSDSRNIAAAESYLRRALEALHLPDSKSESGRILVEEGCYTCRVY
ncbi:hypothetical protein CLG94_02945 [Candidatus Methylomirabilis limnetica]|jgi:hypothetical protein|uniref:Uncharacterized protein n=1 Tax=Candidatus Methylomirabilis limnetica TaxID=2033718 RepID=A0A2T4TZV7_9BACT|nr:hypothetical protein [Candidatus Methylomirabilis limnetica]PTL36654.1 hypothetical protein CLG94_02945 [Candidatus Methylomirabilis limnetica]